jgi:peptidoglycan/xylan/chitin deacetylase (PgdA/CDA1 family)
VIGVRDVLRAATRLAPDAVLIRRLPRGTRAISLTFDDGPDDSTPELLDLLDEHDLLATFFLLGEQCEKRPDLVDAILRRGHEVASHGWEHRHVPEMTADELARDLARTQRVLPPARRARPLFRPPRGRVSPSSLARIASLGFTTALWSYDGLDWRLRTEEALLGRFRADPPRAGDVVLLHEGEPATRALLPTLARMLRERELRSVPISFATTPGAAPT